MRNKQRTLNNKPKLLTTPGKYLLRTGNVLRYMYYLHVSYTVTVRKYKTQVYEDEVAAFKTAQSLCNKNGWIYTSDPQVFFDQS